MQNKKVNEFVLVAVPLDTLIESGVDINGIMQIISKASSFLFVIQKGMVYFKTKYFNNA